MEFKNKKAIRNYHIERTFEAGIVLTGNEIKSIRAGKVNFIDSFAKIVDGEVWLESLHISQYKKGFYQKYDPRRPRKLLLKKYEIKRMQKNIEEKGYTLIPTRIYINEKALAKVEIAIAKGKREYEKRDKIQKYEAHKEMSKYL